MKRGLLVLAVAILASPLPRTCLPAHGGDDGNRSVKIK